MRVLLDLKSKGLLLTLPRRGEIAVEECFQVAAGDAEDAEATDGRAQINHLFILNIPPMETIHIAVPRVEEEK